MAKIIGLIPVRKGSQRIKDKNFREFFNKKSLLGIKIDQLKNSKKITEIYIASDSIKATKIAKNNNVNFIKRSNIMCKASTQWSDSVHEILKLIPGNPIIVWALVTAPLFNNFDRAINSYLKNSKTYDSLVGVIKKKTFLINKHGVGINFNPGYWHPNSQDLESVYEIAGSIFIGRKDTLNKSRYWFGSRPFLYNINQIESVDIDTLKDFKLGQKLFAK